MTELKTGILLWSQAATWAEMHRGGDPGRSARLRPPLDVGPPLRDLRRPVSGLLRGLCRAGRVGAADRAHPAGTARRRQHVPQSGHRRQDDRRHSTTSATAGRSSASAAPGSSWSTRRTGSTSGRASASGSTGSTSRSAAIRALLDGETVTSEPGGATRSTGSSITPRRSIAPADHDRRQWREEDAADGREVRRHVERDGPARR